MAEKNHDVFIRLVGRIMGVLDFAKVDENVKKTVKAYIWQAEKDLNEVVENDRN